MVIWQGVYNTFNDTGLKNRVFLSQVWLNKQKEKVSVLSETFLPANESGELAIDREYPLAVLVSVLADTNSKIKVLDFGGGMGEQYLKTLAKIPDRTSDIFFDVVESKKTIQELPAQMKSFKNLRFFEETPGNQIYDVIHFGSVMQYIEHWQDLLRSLCRCQTRYIVFSDFLGGEIPTFVTTQKYNDEKIPVRWYSFKEFSSFLGEIGFRLTYKAYYQTEILGSGTLGPLCDLPTSHKLKHTLNLIFKAE